MKLFIYSTFLPHVLWCLACLILYVYCFICKLYFYCVCIYISLNVQWLLQWITSPLMFPPCNMYIGVYKVLWNTQKGILIQQVTGLVAAWKATIRWSSNTSALWMKVLRDFRDRSLLFCTKTLLASSPSQR